MTVGLSSGVYSEEEPPQVRAIQSDAPAVLAALGITERGPLEAQLVTSYQEFERLFGGYTPNGNLSLALKGFFENGGSQAYVKRVVHHTDAGDAATKQSAAASLTLQTAAGDPTAGSITGSFQGAFNVPAGGTVLVSVNGGADATATFNGTAAGADSGSQEPYALADDQTLTVTVDGGAPQTITFDVTDFATIGAATALEVAAAISSRLTGGRAVVQGGNAVRIESNRKGSTSRVQVTGGTANGVLGFGTTEQSGTGNVANLAAVTPAEAISIIGAAAAGSTVTSDGGKIKITSGTTGPSSSVQVGAGSTARTAFGFDTTLHGGTSGGAVDAIVVNGRSDGSYANQLRVQIAAPSSARAGEFNLNVLDESNTIRERWPNLSINPASPAFYESVVNHDITGSSRIRLTGGVGNPLPANGTFGPLTGGADGLTGISDADFIGSTVSKTGLRGFDLSEDARVLISPDRETALMHVAMLQYAENDKKGSIFAVLSPPMGLTPTQARTYVETTAGLYNLSEFGCMQYPNIKILNPNTAIFGSDSEIVVPNSGHVAGAFARQDASREGGIYEAAAGIERGQLLGAVGLETDATNEERNRDLLYPSRINPIRRYGRVVVLDGVRTLKGDGNFPTIPERRGVIHMEQAINNGTDYARFRNNDADLRAELTRVITAYLDAQMRVGAFRSKIRATAFFVDISEAQNPPSVVFAGCVIGRIGFATQKPAEFIIFKYSQDTRALVAELSATG